MKIPSEEMRSPNMYHNVAAVTSRVITDMKEFNIFRDVGSILQQCNDLETRIRVLARVISLSVYRSEHSLPVDGKDLFVDPAVSDPTPTLLQKAEKLILIYGMIETTEA